MSLKEKVVIAIGGNSLLLPGMNMTVANQRNAVWETAFSVASIAADGYRVIISHGNGPQVGLVMRRSELAKPEIAETTLDYAVAETQGGIGYQLQQALQDELAKRGIHEMVLTVVTQCEVSSADPGFKNPTKPIGSFMDKDTAMKMKQLMGWNVVEDSGRGWRRVVASPWPKSIIEAEAIKFLVENNAIVIACGGGGIPVVKSAEGLAGIEAVIDKDRASAVLALEVKADILLISTAVPKVYINFGKPDQKALDVVNLETAERYMAEGHFAKGSMGPKVEAAVHFIRNGGKKAVITDPGHIKKALAGEAGTIIVP